MMISRRNFLAVAGATAAAAALTACGGSASSTTSTASSTVASSAASSEAASTEAKVLTKVAIVCDSGTIDDESFNQACYTAAVNYMTMDGTEYYLPPDDPTDEDRETLIRRAVQDGAQAVICVGYLYGASLAWAAEQYPDTCFIAVDVTKGDIGTDEIPANVHCITFKEEQAGYLAGYAVVKDGYKKLGFLGGMAVPAVIRFGYGYVQGADAAAQELGENVEINYFYGGQFFGDATITSRMEGWYATGTEVVFACGGGIWTSAAEAAVKYNGWVVGVDVDQYAVGRAGVEEGSYSYNPFITSAMKGLSEAVESDLATIDANEWSTIAGTNGNFGLEEGEFVGLPTAEESWGFKTFTVDEYEAVKAKIKNGELVVDNNDDDATKPTVSANTTVNYIQ